MRFLSPQASSRPRSRHAFRGQAVVELALVAPLLMAFVFAIFSFWLYYQKTATYTSAAQTLAEWVARDGQYNPAMGAQIKAMLGDAIFVNPEESYLSISIDGDTIVGAAVPDASSCSAPGDPGWNGSIDSDDILVGEAIAVIAVDIWGCHSIGAPAFNLAVDFVPDGHAVMRSMYVLP